MYEWYDFSLKETGVRFDYVLLFLIMFFIFIVSSRHIAKSIHNKSAEYWKKAVIPIIIFSLIEGMRYARGVDYIVYLYKYEYEFFSNALKKQVSYINYFLTIKKRAFSRSRITELKTNIFFIPIKIFERCFLSSPIT